MTMSLQGLLNAASTAVPAYADSARRRPVPIQFAGARYTIHALAELSSPDSAARRAPQRGLHGECAVTGRTKTGWAPEDEVVRRCTRSPTGRSA